MTLSLYRLCTRSANVLSLSHWCLPFIPLPSLGPALSTNCLQTPNKMFLFFSLLSSSLDLLLHLPFFPPLSSVFLGFPLLLNVSFSNILLSLSFFIISANLLDFTPSPGFIFMAVLECSGMFHLWEHHLIVCYSSRFQTILKFAVHFLYFARWKEVKVGHSCQDLLYFTITKQTSNVGIWLCF